MPACRCNLQRALGGFLTLYLAQIGAVIGKLGFTRLRGGEQAVALEVIEQRQQIGRGDHFDRARPCSFRALRGRAHQTLRLRRGMECRQQHAGGRRDPGVEAKLADDDIIGERFRIDHAHRPQHAERDRQIVMRSFLGQIGGREVYGDPLGRQRKAERGNSGTHPLAAFGNGLVGEPDHIEGGYTGRDLDLHFHPARFQPQIRHCRYDCDHRPRPRYSRRSSPARLIVCSYPLS